MKRVLTFVTLCIISLGCSNATDSVAPKPPDLKNDAEKTLYTLGFATGVNMQRYRMNADEWAAFQAGLADAHAKRASVVDHNAWRQKVPDLLRSRDAEALAEQKKLAEKLFAKVSSEPGVRKTASGLLFKTVTEGTGPSPSATDEVKVKYRGSFVNGTEFDSSDKHGGSSSFQVDKVIRCWSEGIQLMKPGGKAVLYCPPEIAYGEKGAPPAIPPGATLVFDVELLEINPNADVTPATPAKP